MTAQASRVAVLGGTGWVGRHVCEVFARNGYDVVVVARNPVPHVCGNEFVPLDLATAAQGVIADFFGAGRFDVVVNATDAANANDGWSRTEEQLYRSNVGLVHRIIAAMASLPQSPRLVHFGTIFEYGPVAVGEPMHEFVPPKPVGAYARTKLAGSAAVLDACRAGTISGLVLRLVNVCGPHPSPASFPGKLLASLRSAVVNGGGVEVAIAAARRDFVDVRDVAEACFKAAESATTGHAVNIGSGIAVELRELVELFVATAGLPRTALEPRAEVVSSLGPDWTKADIRLAMELLEWRPRITLSESVRATWEDTVPEEVSSMWGNEVS
ncbi:NAD(P)-dependent oxidoreductase [Nocardia salmonicida]|uniref:NAD-dependent epimerase/dehydratase family protein n=1 Tax=Nocardia salmonicida TaxID=53431 RepID=UPI0033DB6CD0